MAVEAGAVRIRMAMNAGEFTRGVQQVNASMDKLAARAAKVGAAITSAFAADKLGAFFSDATRAWGVQEQAVSAVEAAIKATGGTAGFTTKQLVKMAGELQKISTFGDEDILKNLTANLLTFTNVVGPVFEEAQKQALNLSARLGQDLKSSVIQLGKALNDPIKGITALSRVGVAFTETQKEQIKTLMKSGDIMAAQKIILAELGHEFENQATALAQTTQGKLTQAMNAVGDAMESVGQAIAPIVEYAAGVIQHLAEAFQNLSPETQRFIAITAGAAAVLAGAAAAMAAFAVVLGAISAPIVIAVGAIALLAGAVAAFWPKVSDMANNVIKSFQSIYEGAKKWLVDYIGPILSGFSTAFDVAYKLVGEGASVLRKKLTSETPGAVAAAGETADAIVQLGDAAAQVKKRLDERTPEAVAAAKGMMEAMGAALRGEEAPQKEPAKEAAALTQEQAIAELQKRAQAEAAAQAAAAAAKKAHADAQAELNKQINEGVRLAKQVEEPREKQLRQMKALDAAYKANKISVEALGRAQRLVAMTVVHAYAGVISQATAAMAQLFNKNKTLAIASALVNTFEGVTKALAAYPPPLSYIAAAGALAAGMAQVQNIKSTTASGGGGGGAATSGGDVSAAAEVPQPQQGVYITLEGERYGREQVRALIEQINEAVADGAVVKVM
jgi:hypothetical protein